MNADKAHLCNAVQRIRCASAQLSDAAALQRCALSAFIYSHIPSHLTGSTGLSFNSSAIPRNTIGTTVASRYSFVLRVIKEFLGAFGSSLSSRSVFCSSTLILLLQFVT